MTFVATRVLWLVTAMRSTFYWEESYRWIAANELLHHPFHSLLVYQADHYQGGTLAMILLATGVMKLFGQTPFVFKMALVLYSGATLTALYILVRKGFGRVEAIVAAVGYIAAPPLAAYWSIVITGSHTESVLFSMVTTLLVLRLLHDPARTRGAWLVLGIVSGLGIWFCYTSAITLAACAMVWLLLRGVPGAGELAAGAGGGLVGLLPWFAYNIPERFAGLTRVVQIFGYGDSKDLWLPQSTAEKLWHVVTRDIPAGATQLFDAHLPSWMIFPLEIAFAVPLFVAISISVVRVAMLAVPVHPRADPAVVEIDATLRAREAVFVVYLALFVALIGASSFTVDDLMPLSLRFYVPPLVLAPVLMALSVARAAGRGTVVSSAGAGEVALPLLGRVGGAPAQPRLVAGAAMAAALAYGAACVVSLVVFAAGHADSQASLASLGGYNVQGLLLHLKYESDLTRAERIAREVGDRVARSRIFAGIGWGVATRVRAGGSFASAREAVEKGTSPEERAGMIAGITWGARIILKTNDASSEAARMVPGRIEAIRGRMTELLSYAEPELNRLPPSLRLLGFQRTTLPGYFEEPVTKPAGG
ncbi:MAG: glycosyltransferase family 39 protein [Deltaproteobacteria bacterium]|nr:glycosyltransferase family 39 protein [Deltaproteobacteria bacterium]